MDLVFEGGKMFSSSEKTNTREETISCKVESEIPSEFPYEWSSFGGGVGGMESSLSLSCNNSPVESLVGSTTETSSEDDGDDYMADLAHQMAHSMLDDDDKLDMSMPFQVTNQAQESKAQMMSRSPQSILPGEGCWSSATPKAPSPPSAKTMVENPEAWDLVYAAAGKVMRVKMEEHNKSMSMYSHHGNTREQNNTSPVVMDKVFGSSNTFSGFRSKDKAYALQRSWSEKVKEEDMKQQLHSHNHVRQTKQQQNHVSSPWSRQVKFQQSQQAHTPPTRNKSGRVGRSDYGSQAWPGVKQNIGGSGMRAVFLGTNGSGRESGGTGVFLPRRNGCNSDLRRKPSCSTVLIPPKIFQALNLEELNCHPSLYSHSALLLNRRDALLTTPGLLQHQGLNHGGRPTSQCKVQPRTVVPELHQIPLYASTAPSSLQIQAAPPDIILPQEWTY